MHGATYFAFIITYYSHGLLLLHCLHCTVI